MSIDLEEIKRAVKAKKYYIRAHARKRMIERGIEKEEVEKAIYSCSFDGEEVYIITAHWMDPKEWIDPWTRRR